jgi:hypothetical protein
MISVYVEQFTRRLTLSDLLLSEEEILRKSKFIIKEAQL